MEHQDRPVRVISTRHDFYPEIGFALSQNPVKTGLTVVIYTLLRHFQTLFINFFIR